MEAIRTLENLVYNLNLGPGYEGYTAMITAVDFSGEDLEKMCQWNSERYQRIRIYDTDAVEALITCWEPGQKGPVHNYGFQQGWVKVLRGELKLEYFGQISGTPEAFNQRIVKEGEVVYLNDALGYHRFSNPSDHRCTALHFYSDKINKWQVYNENTGEIEELPTACDRNLDI